MLNFLCQAKRIRKRRKEDTELADAFDKSVNVDGSQKRDPERERRHKEKKEREERRKRRRERGEDGRKGN